jgi:competence protein ComEC
MKIVYGNTSALLEADAEKAAERYIEREEPQADVLKVAHHGSASSTAASLLTAVAPHFAVISVGAHNVYHHPRAEVLERLQTDHVITYRTDMEGATSFFLDGTRVTPQISILR